MANILLVDDAAFMRLMLKNMLEGNGHTIVGEAADGEQGFSKYKEVNPDITFLDITMPVKNGLECLKDIKGYNPDAKVIMCSAMGQQAMVIEAIQNGAKNFVVKPFNEDRILAALNKIM